MCRGGADFIPDPPTAPGPAVEIASRCGVGTTVQIEMQLLLEKAFQSSLEKKVPLKNDYE